MAEIRWGVLGTGSIARTVVAANPDSFAAIASRSEPKAAAAAAALSLGQSYGTYEELVGSDAIDAVYIALPSSLHAEWTVKALEAGKHVLCEKPFVSTRAEAERCFDAAERADRQLVEAFMWRLHPQTALARRLVADGVIGEVAHIRAALRVTVDTGDIRFSPELQGGALGDLGCYCLSAMRLFAGEPRRVAAAAEFTGVDVRFAGVLQLPGGVLGTFDAALDLPRADELELVGTEGSLRIADPWICRGGHLEVTRKGVTERVAVDPAGEYGLTGEEADAYRIEVTAMSQAIATRIPLEFGREDAVAQATAYEALMKSARLGTQEVLG